MNRVNGSATIVERLHLQLIALNACQLELQRQRGQLLGIQSRLQTLDSLVLIDDDSRDITELFDALSTEVGLLRNGLGDLASGIGVHAERFGDLLEHIGYLIDRILAVRDPRLKSIRGCLVISRFGCAVASDTVRRRRHPGRLKWGFRLLAAGFLLAEQFLYLDDHIETCFQRFTVFADVFGKVFRKFQSLVKRLRV
ncbi:hypothetical protein [Bifidobacterium sp.]|uniref:hypothetical protein n=1 Tax=Bifidobacterium sp. TaxID=41200 RepID=UPI0025BC11F0|nr:hypothetical protein [Bifidobacterium sp.]MCI1635168.1 hypothetical protein [Bifidobacterium sp.]